MHILLIVSDTELLATEYQFSLYNVGISHCGRAKRGMNGLEIVISLEEDLVFLLPAPFQELKQIFWPSNSHNDA